ncbi:uracil-DNA glycosylase [Qingshengfaniella alkalisoli]|uniref:Type-4 uracil-DNA glycosylase n=1 Tax=Qingshengfaniella alkalisoli TaxID=2599296 RepID=A0A5B8IZ64_9RHOB|nr:uracil-DNA glycosylase [Qingshengfaniella alkalisoli]QDY70211.1 uracil-DNA glycosylase [Qingshengfaniella alkalisoli]
MMAMPDPNDIKALLDWQAELGADEPLGEVPANRYVADPGHQKAEVAPQATQSAIATDPVSVAAEMARESASLEDLRQTMGEYRHCDLYKGARNLVFCDGQPQARVMILGEAPGREEDVQGKPFVGRAGQLLDKMLGAIGMDRASPDPQSAVYITNVLPWRPPQNREPTPDEMAMMLPFVKRHIELVDPDVLVLMGNVSCQAMLGRKGITRLRGNWQEVSGRPCLPMFHPAYLLRNPHAKREAWADLLELKARLLAE